MKTYSVNQDFINALVEVFDNSDLEYEAFEGTLLNNFVFFANKEIRVAGRKTKYIIIREVALNEWSSDYEMILTDSDKKANAFVEEFDVYEEDEDMVNQSTESVVVSSWYAETFPNDDMVNEIKSGATFMDVFEALDNYKEVHSLIGNDSIIRERVFEKLTQIMKVDYDYIYNQWLQTA